MLGRNVTVSARIGTLKAMAPEVEPIRNAKTAGTTENSIIAGMFVFASIFPRISDAPGVFIFEINRHQYKRPHLQH